ncbi:MAG TPA: FtsW/RodA/SpoVE family cell cycle protein, partial [Actinomycetota bacterium]|nr:FtsW/RodA/SpoVE family cell cycle protein [Actinomycetota bacterium]
MYQPTAGRIGRVQRRRSTSIASKTPIRHLDGILLLTAFALTAFGNLMVYSASRTRLAADGLPERYLVNRQMLFSLLGLVAMIVVASFSYRRLKAWGPVAYV